MDGGRPLGGRRPLTHLWPLPYERKHGRRATSSDAVVVPSTLASGVVVCRVLPAGYRAFAACSPPASPWPPPRACEPVPSDPGSVGPGTSNSRPSRETVPTRRHAGVSALREDIGAMLE
jgi:hypothetical protein